MDSNALESNKSVSIRHARNIEPNIDFAKWVKKVDKIVYTNIKLHLQDLPDEDFWINWNNGMNYKLMANNIIKDQKNFLDSIL